MYDGVKAVARRPRRVAAAAVLAATPVQAALITQAEPFVDGDYVKLPHELVNDDNQAEFDSFDLSSLAQAQDLEGNVYQTLGHALYQLVPENQTAYASAEEMMADWIVPVLPDPFGEVNEKWEADASDMGNIRLYHSGRDPEPWLATQQDPDMDMLATAPAIPIEHFGDLSLRLTEESYPGVGVGHQTGGFPDIAAEGKRYVVVPEPSALALIGLGGLGMGLRRRRNYES
jgi:hypothetical protein